MRKIDCGLAVRGETEMEKRAGAKICRRGCLLPLVAWVPTAKKAKDKTKIPAMERNGTDSTGTDSTERTVRNGQYGTELGRIERNVCSFLSAFGIAARALASAWVGNAFSTPIDIQICHELRSNPW